MKEIHARRHNTSRRIQSRYTERNQNVGQNSCPGLRIIFEGKYIYLAMEPYTPLEALIYNSAIDTIVRSRLLDADAPMSYRCGTHEAGYQYWKIEHVELGDSADIMLEIAKEAEKVREKLA